MAVILNLETATTNCSVCVAKEGKVLALREHNSPNYSHSEQLHNFIKEALEEASFSITDLDAIAVSQGPGSYTGLRIGVSAAKGLCFSLDLPLIAIPTLESLAHQVTERGELYIVPVLDARRMEVYSAVFNESHGEIRETRAEIITEASFGEYIGESPVHLIGSGAEKCKELLVGPNLIFNTLALPSAREMALLSYKRFKAAHFENVAYFEPFYLKDFILQQKKR
jgi:tRNA threonylcarbamoyladenosine biosynthesis protein TsaB